MSSPLLLLLGTVRHSCPIIFRGYDDYYVAPVLLASVPSGEDALRIDRIAQSQTLRTEPPFFFHLLYLDRSLIEF